MANHQSYSTFVFEQYHLDPTTKTITLTYSFDSELHFTETITLPADMPMERANSPDVQRALFALHLAGGISYYKAYAPQNIAVRSSQLTKQQTDFWNEFYTKGLGEFFYTNKIDFKGLINFPVSQDAPQPLPAQPAQEPRTALVPFGGGKDSQVTVEILRRAKLNITLFRMQGHPFITELADLNKLPLLQVSRTLDPRIYELNKQGALNGHVPITGYVTFLTILVALLAGHDSVFFSNERSSDYGNVDYLGMQVNHQWSKSLQAEHMLTDYIQQFVTTNVRYLNALRPLSELHIAKLFTREPKYFAHVTSCNRNWRWNDLERSQHSGRWCGQCEKCAFVFAMFAAFLPLEQLGNIFHKNLFNDATLLPFYRQLWGAEDFKPFECVGTPQETQAALYLATRSAEYADTVIGHAFTTTVLPTLADPQQLMREAFTPDYSGVSPYIASMIKKELTHEDNRS